MTKEDREESVRILKMLIPKDSRGNGKVKTNIAVTEAIVNAVEALEQEPCEDCISRKEYIKRYRAWHYSEYGCKPSYDTIAIMLANSMPSVKQEPKTGHWQDADYMDEWWGQVYICSECGESMIGKSNYCPDCGARMVEPQERSDKE